MSPLLPPPYKTMAGQGKLWRTKLKNMRTKKRLIMSGLMALVLGLGISSSALAYQGDFSKDGLNYNSDFEAQITEVMINNNYEGWKELVEEKVGKSEIVGVINKNNFPKFVKAWKLAHEGRIKEANTIRRELSLNR